MCYYSQETDDFNPVTSVPSPTKSVNGKGSFKIQHFKVDIRGGGL